MNKNYELISHTADLSIHVWGNTLEELFKYAVEAFFSIRIPLYYQQSTVHNRMISLKSSQLELLLVDFLSEILYLSAVHHETYVVKKIAISNDTLFSVTAELVGNKYTDYRGVEIKAVTYHNLHIEQKDTLWHATITFDI